MNNMQRRHYQQPEALRDILFRCLNGKKFRLDCGHHITFGQVLGNDITIRNGRKLRIICAQCGY